jgi:hypothetical protein
MGRPATTPGESMFALTTVLSAFLLFLLQALIGKYVLP